MLGLERIQLVSGRVVLFTRVARESRPILQAHLKKALALRSPLASRRMECCELSLCSGPGVETFTRMQTIVSCGADDARDLLVTLTDLSGRPGRQRKAR